MSDPKTKDSDEMNDSDDFLGRAMAAWFRSEGSGSAQPSNDSGVRPAKGMDYVVLENSNGILAVYRIKSDGFLKRLRRWPSELDSEAGAKVQADVKRTVRKTEILIDRTFELENQIAKMKGEKPPHPGKAKRKATRYGLPAPFA